MSSGGIVAYVYNQVNNYIYFALCHKISGLGMNIYAFELFITGLAGLVVLSGLVCFRETAQILRTFANLKLPRVFLYVKYLSYGQYRGNEF